MSLEVIELTPELEPAYERLLLQRGDTLLYAGLKYRAFLREVTAPSEDRYLLAAQDGRVVGALPLFIKRSARFGAVINSLPFFGSNGGMILAPDARNPAAVWGGLLSGLEELGDAEGAASTVVVTNPLDPQEAAWSGAPAFPQLDQRIGQLTPLPDLAGQGPGAVGETLLGLYHAKTRNCVRKAIKSGVEVRRSDSDADWRFLADLHWANITALGGTAKPRLVFEALRGCLAPGADRALYIASHLGRDVAALLVLRFNRTAEYFVPATDPEARILQPASLLIFEAMRDAAAQGCLEWNWGGTWATQAGVYDFKSRWGTRDLPYVYRVRMAAGAALRRATRAELLAEFPYFYALPFSLLDTRTVDPEAAPESPGTPGTPEAPPAAAATPDRSAEA